MNKYSVKADCIITPDKRLDASYLNVGSGRIAGLAAKSSGPVVDLSGTVVAPAFVDAHDHLFGNYYPKIGRGDGSYLNWKPWDDDLKAHPVYKERANVQPVDIYRLASYKHIFSGCLTVSDHMPHRVNEPLLEAIKEIPIRIQRKYCLAHESSSYDLRWGDGIVFEHRRAVKEKIPFITHIEEGWDEEATKGIDILKILGALTRNTVLIHAIALSDKDMNDIAKAGASCVWCPGSNWFMFRKTGQVKKWLAKGINVSLGTDSPHTGELNMLYEARWGRKLYRKIYGSDLPYKTLLGMMTINPAKALWLDGETGSLEKGKSADFIAVSGRDVRRDPWKAVIESDFAAMSLVVYRGKPVYGDPARKDFFKQAGVPFRKISVAGTDKIINGDPDLLLKRIRKNVGFRKDIPFLPVDV
jgi:cytosine/adenosine deaminase-related metal-dependent hydrolase